MRSGVLVIGPDARWFSAPDGTVVDLTRRKPLRRLLACLAAHHGQNGCLGVDDLIAAGWPGERMSREAGANRVRVALAALRKLGLRDEIQSRDRGYALDPALDVRTDDRARPPAA
jgi:hypothetical protein